jgi:hypothetical protein
VQRRVGPLSRGFADHSSDRWSCITRRHQKTLLGFLRTVSETATQCPIPTAGLRRGVFVSDTSAPRRPTDVVLKIEWNGAPFELDRYAYNVRVWPPHGNDYREWLVPAVRLQACAVRRY